MDKSWIHFPRNTPEYKQGLNNFLDYALERASIDGRIICPCPKCKFKIWETREVVYDHLIVKPFPVGYTYWVRHGESMVQTSTSTANLSPRIDGIEDPIHDLIHETFGYEANNVQIREDELPDMNIQEPNDLTKDFDDLIRDGEESLYEGCTKYSKLSFMLHLYHIKVLCKVPDKAMDMILELLTAAFEHAKIVRSLYEAKKTIKKLGLDYTKIDACPNDCMLYWGEDEGREDCKRCGISRWKLRDADSKKKKIPAKILRYFPLKPRLQRLFLSSKTAEQMRWHAMDNPDDGVLRHPRDGEAWKSFDLQYPQFSSDCRNVRLALATDGFDPYGNLSTNYSIWPVMLVPYNLPPWACMKQSSIILSMIIPGKKMPGNNIDVYLQPLIRELMELWVDGIDTYDASTKEIFKMRAAVTWTISDFPGLGILSGWNTYTGLACPYCNFDFIPRRLPYSKKWCFIGHRRWLRPGHRFRLNRVWFDGNEERRNPPVNLSGTNILGQLENVNVTFGRPLASERKGKRPRHGQGSEGEPQQWKKKSIFFELPYWQFNSLRHSLDLMHIEKNILDNVLYTIMGESGKSKDHDNARRDLKTMGIRPDLWVPDDGSRPKNALFKMTNSNRKHFLRTLKNIIVPDGYSSNISRCVDTDGVGKISGLKSHDCHILMEQLLPLAIRNTLPAQVSVVLVEFCAIFKHLSSRVVKVADLHHLQERIVITLCHLEMLFPPSFFTVMVHLTVHLVDELKKGGPNQFRWMYPIERYLGQLKSYVRNRAQPEGSIAEGYIAQECLTHCSRYLDGVETLFNRPRRVDDEPIINSSTFIPQIGRHVGGSSYFNLSPKEKLQAHRHVLTNSKEVEPFLQRYRTIVKRKLRGSTRSQVEIDKKVHREFPEWFKGVILNDDNSLNSVDLKFLAQGPINQARRFTAYNVNGFKFRTVDRDEGLRTQNSGVFGTFGTRSYASSNDSNMRFGGVPYYGRLVDIIEINYYGRFMVTLFKCQWANTTNSTGFKIDNLGFNCVNFSRLIHTGEREDDEPYIQASEAQMVYYVADEVDKDWKIAVHLKPRDLYEMGGDDNDNTMYESELNQQNLERFFDQETTHIQLGRDGDD